MDDRYKDRETLKSYFRRGAVPTEEQFAELIDSVPNIHDDGLVLLDGRDAGRMPEDERGDHLGTDEGTSSETNEEAVSGASGLIPGTSEEEETPVTNILKVKPNGHWYSLPVEAKAGQNEEGCRVYRISACYLNDRYWQYSACEAIASHSEGQGRRVISRCRHWWGWSGHIKIRWKRVNGRLCLQMRSKRTYGDSGAIYCRIETLWNL